MRLKYIRASVILLFLSIIGLSSTYASKGTDDKWRPLVETKSGYKLYLDTEDILNTENGTIVFWIKAIKPNEHYDLSMYEIDCSKNLFTIHSLIDFQTGDIVDTEMSSEPKWVPIDKATAAESIKKAVCGVKYGR